MTLAIDLTTLELFKVIVTGLGTCWIIGLIAVRLTFPSTWWTMSNVDGVLVTSRWRWLVRWRFRRAVRRAVRKLPRARVVR